MEQTVNSEVKQYVVFKLGREEYGLNIQKVTTIEKVMAIARVPKTPAFIKGVINKIEEISVGLVVDAVEEVMQLTEDSVESLSSFSNDLSMDYILGVGKINNRIITLLNLDILIELEENL